MHHWKRGWVLYPCRNNMLCFQCNSQHFQLPACLACLSWRRHCLFLATLPRYSCCWSLFSISVHSHLWVCSCFFYSYFPSSRLAQRGAVGLALHQFLYAQCVFAGSFNFLCQLMSPFTHPTVLSTFHYFHSWCVWSSSPCVYHQTSFHSWDRSWDLC